MNSNYNQINDIYRKCLKQNICSEDLKNHIGHLSDLIFHQLHKNITNYMQRWNIFNHNRTALDYYSVTYEKVSDSIIKMRNRQSMMLSVNFFIRQIYTMIRNEIYKDMRSELCDKKRCLTMAQSIDTKMSEMNEADKFGNSKRNIQNDIANDNVELNSMINEAIEEFASGKPGMIKEIIYLRMKGYGNCEISRKIGMHPKAVARLISTLRKEIDFKNQIEYLQKFNF